MMKRLLMTTAAASLLAMGASAYAQDNTGATGQSQQPPVVTPTPPASNDGTTGTTDMNAPADPATSAAPAPADPPAPAAEAAPPASPPPSDAVISAQSDGEVRADQIIGMTVYNAEGEKVGTVHDILLDKEGKATGVVLSVGGLLGVGAKSVGLTWKEIDVNPEQQQVQISYTADQLKAAPDFKTTEQINSEMNAQQAAPPAAAPAPAPAPADGTSTTAP
jgi:sporulation protein YlmC with PRC-barrel domain